MSILVSPWSEEDAATKYAERRLRELGYRVVHSYENVYAL